MSDKVQTLLDTLRELSGILYARPEERCTRGILRVHNQTFLHAIVCEEVIGKPQILSEKTFYWWYLHSLVVHAPIQHRIICCRSTNTEQQESHFNTLLSISTSTSSRRPGEITPGIIRMQAEVKAENNQRDTLTEQQSRLSTLLASSTEHHYHTQSDPEVSTCLTNTPGKKCRLPPLRWKNLKEACSEWHWIFWCQYNSWSSTRSWHFPTFTPFLQTHTEVRNHIPARQLEEVCGIRRG